MDKKQQIIETLESNTTLKHRKDFTISKKSCGYSMCYTIKITNLNVSLKPIEKLIQPLEHYERGVDYEILQGGNTFIDVKYASSKNQLFKVSGEHDYDVYFSDIFEEYAYDFRDKSRQLLKDSMTKLKDLGRTQCVVTIYSHGIFDLNVCYYDNQFWLKLVPNFDINHTLWQTRASKMEHFEKSLATLLAKLELGHFTQDFKECSLEEYHNYNKKFLNDNEEIERHQKNFENIIANKKTMYDRYKNNDIKYFKNHYSKLIFENGFVDLSKYYNEFN